MGGGNPIKKIEETVKKASRDVEKTVSTASKQVESGAKRAGADLSDSDWYSQMAAAAAAAAQDPMALATGGMTGGITYGKAGKESWDTMSDAQKAEARAKEEQRMTQNTERAAMAEQAKMTENKAKAAAASAKERAARMGQGRRGLLFQGKESGVTGLSKTLGG